MALRVAINGFGRIGRNVLRSAKQTRQTGIDFVGINDLADADTLAHLFKYDTSEELLVALGNGTLGMHQVSTRLMPPEERAPAPGGPVRSQEPRGIRVLGVSDVVTRLAPCCDPLPGDEIVGFITRARGVTVHRSDCPSIASEDEPERLVPVAWESAPGLYPVEVSVEALDRVGLCVNLIHDAVEFRVGPPAPVLSAAATPESIHEVGWIMQGRELGSAGDAELRLPRPSNPD